MKLNSSKKGKSKKKFIKNQKGQSIMEYVIVSSLIGIVCLTAISSLGKDIDNRVKNISSKIKKSINI